MSQAPRHAARCVFLRMTLDSKQGGLLNLCQHIVRSDRECVGPFLDDTETTCGLWEGKPGGFAPAVHGFEGAQPLRELPRRDGR